MLTPGTRLGVYEVAAAIGQGGMGEVYRARDTRLKRDVALKILPESFATDPERLARFQREAEVLALLNHPNIAAIHGLEESNGTRALVMELVEGETLADRIARGPIQIDEALPIAKQIAEALEAAHEQGIVHRDLKPANIKLRPEGVPFWSPDSASVGFFADSKLKRVDIVGGARQELANAVAGAGGAWNRDGTILFAPTGVNSLSKVPAVGGEPVVVTRLETGQASHLFPQFLPDGRHFIHFVRGGPGQGVYAGSLDGGAAKRLANADAPAVVSPSGFLFFVRQTTLFAQPFNFERQELSGNPFPVAEQVAFDISIAPGFSASTGIVAYRTGVIARARQLTWLDRSGKSLGTIGTPDSADLTFVELSPDGKRVAVSRTVNGNIDVWLSDAARGVPTRFTFDAAADTYPVWSRDGNRVVFASTRKGPFNLFWKLSSGAGADELLLESDQGKVPTDWSADGRFLLFRSNDPQAGFDLWVLPLSGDRKPIPFLKTPFVERDGQFSPDGKWIAYQSNESGQFEIYVQPFPGPGGQFQISANGGAQPRWDENGREVFYVSLDDKMMAAPVKLSPDGRSLERGTPTVLFPVRIAGGPLPGSFKQQYAISSDGQRFLVNLAADEGGASSITLILNWKPKP